MSAVISDCGKYRYRLERKISDEGDTVMFIGVNPSTADANTDDATVRKWRGFATRWGMQRFIVGNLFAYRATDVNELKTCVDPVGELNEAHLALMMQEVDLVVPCWGSRNKLPHQLEWRIHRVRTLMERLGVPVRVFGLTSSGDPKHPLMLPYSTELQPWNP